MRYLTRSTGHSYYSKLSHSKIMKNPINHSPSNRKGNQTVSKPQGPLALYVHIPFCETKCPYCDFNTYAGIETLIPTYIDALVEEIHMWADVLGSTDVGTIFFGGGTPSYLPQEHIQRLLDTVRSTFAITSNAEITLESNPGDIKPERLAAWRDSGINRLSMGVQSLDDGLLKLLGRRHTVREALDAFHQAQTAGFDNINLDLMYGLPNQGLAQWQRTLDESLEMGPQHLSLYCLTLEEGTPLAAWVRQGKLPTPDPDLAADMYELAEQQVDTAGYHHYEISNWTLLERECRHNLTYWRNQPYLGVGPGAHSYLRGHRFANLRSPKKYIQRVHRWAKTTTSSLNLSELSFGPVDMVEVVDKRLEMGETMMLGLRLSEGITQENFYGRFGRGLTDVYGAVIAGLEEVSLLQWKGSRLLLTPRGRLLGNEVFQRFLA